MTSLNISLPEQLREWIEMQVEGGRYGNASEYVRELIRRDQERQMEHRLDDLIREGIDSGPPSKLSKRDWIELRADIAKRLESRRKRRGSR